VFSKKKKTASLSSQRTRRIDASNLNDRVPLKKYTTLSLLENFVIYLGVTPNYFLKVKK